MKCKRTSAPTSILGSLAALTTVAGQTAVAQPCSPVWVSESGFATLGLDVVRALGTWDPDGPGSLATLLVAGGLFSTAGGEPVSNIAAWDGVQWQALGAGVGGPVQAITSWDPDGEGPTPPLLVVGGSFSQAGETAAANIAAWDGSEWFPLADGLSGTVYALTTWDADGDGPQPARLVAAGSFAESGSLTVNRIAVWDGTEWSPLGSGMASGDVRAVVEWDPDGTGLLPRRLVAGGSFANAGGGVVSNVAMWDSTEGGTWRPLGAGLDQSVLTLAAWRPGHGAAGVQELVAGGYFRRSGEMETRLVAVFNNELDAWQPIGGGLWGDHGPAAFALAAWDPDGAGSIRPWLYATGTLERRPDWYMTWRIARWQGSALSGGPWLSNGSLYASPLSYGSAMTTWSPVSGGSSFSQLVIAGRFYSAGGLDSPGIIRLRWPAACAADFNCNGALDSGDVFGFLNAWFAGESAAQQFGAASGVSAIFAFLSAWFAGCP